MIDLVIPVQRWSAQLDRTLASVEAHTAGHRVHVVQEPSLNVAEARQKAMDELPLGDLVCFLGDDSEMIHDGWLGAMRATLEAHPDAGAVFAGEWWGTEPRTPLRPVPGDGEIEYGPAACMLMDRRRLPAGLTWDARIGLRNGWLGGDFEEVDYCYRLRHAGLKLYRCTSALFHHTGGRATLADFGKTDRQGCVCAMQCLLSCKYHTAPGDDDWFKGLRYLAAAPDNDCNFAPGGSLRAAYRDVVRRNGLLGHPMFKRMGIR